MNLISLGGRNLHSCTVLSDLGCTNLVGDSAGLWRVSERFWELVLRKSWVASCVFGWAPSTGIFGFDSVQLIHKLALITSGRYSNDHHACNDSEMMVQCSQVTRYSCVAFRFMFACFFFRLQLAADREAVGGSSVVIEDSAI